VITQEKQQRKCDGRQNKSEQAMGFSTQRPCNERHESDLRLPVVPSRVSILEVAYLLQHM